MDAGGAERSPAGAGGDFAAFEVAEEFLPPFGVGGGAVFLGGPQRAAAGQEGQVGLDGFVGVGGTGLTSPDGAPLHYTLHDFRRMFLTDGHLQAAGRSEAGPAMAGWR